MSETPNGVDRVEEATEQDWERFGAIIAEGGIVVVHPDTLAAWHLRRTAIPTATVAGVEIRTNPMVPEGMVVALAQHVPVTPPLPSKDEP